MSKAKILEMCIYELRKHDPNIKKVKHLLKDIDPSPRVLAKYWNEFLNNFEYFMYGVIIVLLSYIIHLLNA